jgi:hypothetical protein
MIVDQGNIKNGGKRTVESILSSYSRDAAPAPLSFYTGLNIPQEKKE